MKKVLLAVMLGLMSMCAVAQTTAKKDTIYATSNTRGSGYHLTNWVYKETDGSAYPVYSHVVSRGDRQGQTIYCIRKTSKKTGKQYWKEIKVSNR